MDAAAERTAPLSRLKRSSHSAFIENNLLYVWGGYQVVAGEEIMLPSDEIWLCDLDSGTWERREITGDKPPASFCGSHVNSTLYTFGGYDPDGFTDQGIKYRRFVTAVGVRYRRLRPFSVGMRRTGLSINYNGPDKRGFHPGGRCSCPMFSADLTEQSCSWKKLTDTKGTTPSPRNKHTCWVHRDRLIYFGGYGCKTIGDVRNISTSNFIVEEMAWATIGNTLFRCWGWNNEVVVFDTHTATWSMPETRGPAPAPRGSHASAILGNKGYISGAVENAELDMFCLDLETWTWTQFDISPSCTPLGRSMFTMTPTSDNTLFIYGGLGTDGSTLNDAWQFNTQKIEWNKMTNPHKDKPRVSHTACLGSDNDVVVFGGSSSMCFLMDSVALLRAPVQNHCSDVFVFQTQPYSLFRLCEDFIGKNPELFGKHLNWLPSKLHNKIDKRVAFFSTTKPVLKD